MAETKLASTEQLIEVGDRPTRCLAAGAGPPLLLLHGLGTSADEWCWALPRLAERFHVYAPDLQHLPPRGAPAYLPAPAFSAAFVGALLDALGLPAASLAGNSLGGLVALEAALAMPERVEALVLADSAGLGAAIHPGLQALALPGYGEAAAIWGATPLGSLQRALGRAGLLFASPARAPAAWVAAQRRLAQQPGFLASTLGALRARVGPWGQRDILLGRLPELPMPALVIWGESDRLVPASQARQALSRLRRGQLALIPACGHLPHVEQPAAFVAAVERFLHT